MINRLQTTPGPRLKKTKVLRRLLMFLKPDDPLILALPEWPNKLLHDNAVAYFTGQPTTTRYPRWALAG